MWQKRTNTTKSLKQNNDDSQTIQKQDIDNDRKDIDVMDIECNDTDDEQTSDNEIEQIHVDYSAFLSLSIGERVLLLRIVTTILPHQSAYNLLRCFRRYPKIFGEELKKECSAENVLWFWKRLYFRDFGELIFRKERLQRNCQKRHSKSISQQAKEFTFNKKHSAQFWMKHYLSEYRQTVTIEHNISKGWVYDEVYNKYNQLVTRRRKQFIETVQYHPITNIYESKQPYRTYTYRRFNKYPLERIIILSQHKLKLDKILDIKSFIRCNWFLQIANLYTTDEDGKSVVRRLTNRYHFNASAFRGYINCFDVRLMELFVVQMMMEYTHKCMDTNKKRKMRKVVSLKNVELYSDIKDKERIVLLCRDQYNKKVESVFAFKRMIDFKKLIQIFYVKKNNNEALKIHVLYFERLNQGIVVKSRHFLNT